MSRAVAGATTTTSAAWPRRVCGIGSRSDQSEVCDRLGRERGQRDLADEAGGAPRHDGRDVRAGVDQPAADLDGLVGGDPAADAQDDAAPGQRARHDAYLIASSTSSGRS